jgi:hypothetical protein
VVGTAPTDRSTDRPRHRTDEAPPTEPPPVDAEPVADYPDYPAFAAFLALALADAGHPKAALATMLGCALDAARPGVFDGYERALGEYHRELLGVDAS